MEVRLSNVLGDPAVLGRAVPAGDDLAGSVVAWWEEGRRFIGYWFGRAFWGRGVGSRAMALFLAGETIRPLYADPGEHRHLLPPQPGGAAAAGVGQPGAGGRERPALGAQEVLELPAAARAGGHVPTL
ncbi:hypothetical protein [Nonomuraea sp. NPDC049309]|uniref:hypothetical protein n=1 Tax=Nonomuraea sp. NPDC049309 TaxID=3364350 RepID=UPI0037124FE1